MGPLVFLKEHVEIYFSNGQPYDRFLEDHLWMLIILNFTRTCVLLKAEEVFSFLHFSLGSDNVTLFHYPSLHPHKSALLVTEKEWVPNAEMYIIFRT